MPWNANFKRGADHPTWEWLNQNPVAISYHGTANAWDGVRYMYWVIQYGTTATTASTTSLFRYDTFSDAWQYIANVTSGNVGMDIEYDPIRKCLHIVHGASLSSWQVFNLNTTSITIGTTVCPAWTATTMAPVLPAVAANGASFTMPDDAGIPAQIDSGVVDSVVASTTTTINATEATATFGPGLVGLHLKFTTGNLAGQSRIISSVTGKSTLVVASAFTAAPTAGSAFTVEVPSSTSTGGNTTTTLIDTSAASAWTTNLYANSDVVILSGTGAGQRKRIASNTATTLTLAATVGTNTRTGPWTTVPDATSVYRIVPSSDFLYYQNGNNSTTWYRIDVSPSGVAPTWTTLTAAPGAISGGGNTFYPGQYAPFQILAVRGNATGNFYSYNIGTNAWTTLTTFPAGETWTTGSSSAMLHGKRKIFVAKDGNSRAALLDLSTGMFEPFPQVPYAAPAGYDGKRSRFVRTPDGVEWLYHMRPGGQEFFRIALEWPI